jgi:hypothetical protein
MQHKMRRSTYEIVGEEVAHLRRVGEEVKDGVARDRLNQNRLRVPVLAENHARREGNEVEQTNVVCEEKEKKRQ